MGNMLDTVPLISLFEGLNTRQTALLLTAFENFSSPAETVVFEQGDLATYLYLIIRGSVSLLYKPYDGEQLILTRLKDGDVFGWSAVVGTNRYTSGVITNSHLDAIRLRRDHLLELMKTDPETSKIIIDRLALNVSPRWQNAHKQIEPLIKTKGISHDNN